MEEANKDALEAASRMIDRLSREDRDPKTQEYVDVLTNLVELYESEHVAIPDAPAPVVLRELMASNKLSQLEVARQAGMSSESVSRVLNGTRELTTKEVVALARLFKVAPAAFLPSE